MIDDTYNASLDSIKSSLELLIKREGKRKIAIIGDVWNLVLLVRIFMKK